MKRRIFLERSLAASLGLMTSYPFAAYGNSLKSSKAPKISLAQWSLHRSFEKGKLKAENFASIAANDFQINAVEYVNGFYTAFGKSAKFWQSMRSRADDAGVKSLLIMVDNEGDLGNPDDARRAKAVENHYKWVDAAKVLGCHSVRVNAFGKADLDTLRQTLAEGLGSLAEYGAKSKIHVLIENHGLHSSDAKFMTDIIKEVDNPYLGTLPDFGNWCLNREWGSTQGGRCSEAYDMYKGVKEMLPFAQGVSAKSYEFNAEGDETTIDYSKMLKIVKEANFDGYVGIEYEGSKLSEADGIRATKSLIERSW